MAISDTFNPALQPVTTQGPSVSNREDLTDVLTILAPEETPALSVTSFTDQFASRARLGNYIQKFRRDFMVSDLQEAVDSVGPAKVAQAEAKAIRELKRDVEATILSDNDRQAETGAAPYKMRGLGKFLDGNNADIPAEYETPEASRDANGASIDETQFNTIIRSIYRANGEANNLVLIADTSLRRQIADYARLGNQTTSIRSVNYDGDNSTIKLSVEIYQSDFGIVSIVNMNPTTNPETVSGETTNHDRGYMINPDYYGVHELIPMGSSRLPNMGGGERGFVDCALTLGVYAPAAHGIIT
jgi:hypothetical protein